jgi:hypothetical protein
MTDGESSEALRAAVRAVLAEPEYAWWQPQESPDGIAAAIARWSGDLLRWLAALRTDAPAIYWTLVAGLFIVALALLVHATWTVRVALRARGTAPVTARASRTDFATLAAALAARGEYLEAARHVQLAVLELLLARRVIALERSEPNAVLRARLRAARLPDADRAACVTLLDRLERAWFRDSTASRDLYDDWRRLHGRLADGVPS